MTYSDQLAGAELLAARRDERLRIEQRYVERARQLQASPPDKAHLGRAHIEGCLSVNDVRWVYLAAAFIEAVVTELEPVASSVNAARDVLRRAVGDG